MLAIASKTDAITLKSRNRSLRVRISIGGRGEAGAVVIWDIIGISPKPHRLSARNGSTSTSIGARERRGQYPRYEFFGVE